jgi:hypothetical protein
MRYDTYIGPHHYWIRFHNGTSEVRETEYDNEHDAITTVFVGHYEDCVKFIKNKEIEYLESLF